MKKELRNLEGWFAKKGLEKVLGAFLCTAVILYAATCYFWGTWECKLEKMDAMLIVAA